MNRNNLVRLAPLALLMSLACDEATGSAKTKPAKSESKDAKEPGKGAETPKTATADLPDPCALIDEGVLRAQLGLAVDAKLDVGDKLDAHRFNDHAKSCTWSVDGQMIGLQVTAEPSGNKFDTWASRMLEARKAEGFEAVDGLADGAVFRAKDSNLLIRQGESRLFSLSYAGDRPGATLELDKLKPIAASIVKP